MLTRGAIRAQGLQELFDCALVVLPGDPRVPRQAKRESDVDFRARCRQATVEALLNPHRLPYGFVCESITAKELTRERIVTLVALVDRYFSARGAYMQLLLRHNFEVRVAEATLGEDRTAAWADMNQDIPIGWTLVLHRPVWNVRFVSVDGVDVEGSQLSALICTVCQQLAHIHQFEKTGDYRLDRPDTREYVQRSFGHTGCVPNGDERLLHIRSHAPRSWQLRH